MTRVAIVGASAAVRERLATIVGASGSSTVATAVASIDALVADPRAASSDVVLLHSHSGGVTRRELGALPPVPLVVLVSRAPRQAVVRSMLSAGVRAVLPDDATADEIVAAVDAAAAGLVVVSTDLVSDLLGAPRAASEDARFATSITRTALPALTPRELEILAMLAEGLPNKLIASQLGISDHTVKTHIEALFDKLGASTRAEAVARGVRQGLLLL